MTSTPTLHFTLSTDPAGTAVLHVRGEADLATAALLRERLLAEFARHDPLVIDLSHAMLYDGPALRALHTLYREAIRTRRQPPTLRGVRPALAKALKATGMHTLFPRQDHAPFPAPARPTGPRATGRAPLAAAA